MEKEKAIAYGANFNKDRLLNITNRVLTKLLIPFVSVQESKLQAQLTRSKQQYNDSVTSKEAAEEAAKKSRIELETLKKELESAEASYNRQVQKLGDSHRSSLLRADEDILAKADEIKRLKQNVSSFRRELSKRPTDAVREAYISELEDNYQKIKDRNEELERIRRQAEKRIREQETELKRERSEGTKGFIQLREVRKELALSEQVHGKIREEAQAYQERMLVAEEKVWRLEGAAKLKENELEILREELEIARRRREASIASQSSSAASSRVLVGLQDEIEAATKDEVIDDLEDEVIELKKQNHQLMETLTAARDELEGLQKQQKDAEEVRNKAEERIKTLEKEASEGRDKAAADANKFKKERDELQGQLKKANDKNEDNVKEVRRLKSLEENVKTLQKRERELQSELKLKAQEMRRAEEKVKRVEQESATKSKTQTDELSSQVKQCEKERSELEKRIKELTRQLEQERKEHDEALGNNPSDDELKELRMRLRQAEEFLREEHAARHWLEATIEKLETAAMDERIEAEARIKALATDFEDRLAKSNASRDDLAEYFKELFGNVLERSREVQADLETHTKLSQVTRDAYLDRIYQMNEQVKRNPSGADANVTRRRVIGVEKEVQRMNGIIDALGAENDWFRDVNQRFAEGQERLVKVAEEAAAEAATAREKLAAAEAAAAAAQAGPAATDAGSVIANDGIMWLNILAFVVMSGMLIAYGREFGAIKTVNQPSKRAIYVNSMDKKYFCLKLPTYEFMWEFVIFLIAGAWRWKA